MRYLKKQKISPYEFEFPVNKLVNVQEKFEKLIEKNYYLNCSAKDAYRSFLQAYASQTQRDIFDVNKLELGAISKSFGLPAPPRVDISEKASSQAVRKHKLKDQAGVKK